MDGAVAFDDNDAIGRHRAVDRFLGGTVDVYRHLIASAEHIVLWRGDVHDGVKRQIFVGENITSEDFLPLALLVFLQEEMERVGRGHGSYVVLIILEVGIVFIILLLPGRVTGYPPGGGVVAESVFALRGSAVSLLLTVGTLADTVALAKAAFALRGTCRPQAAVVLHPLIGLAHAADLRDVHTALHEVGDDLRL